MRRAKGAAAADRTVRCPRCSYNLTGVPEPRCPECALTFSPVEWDRQKFDPILPWERGAYANSIWAFVATIFSLTLGPWRRRRSLTLESGAKSAALFYALLIPLAGALSVAVCFLAAKFGQAFPSLIWHYPYWELHLWSNKPRFRMGEIIGVVIRSTAFMLTALAVWLPALVALDLVCWRQRSAFRLTVNALAYSSLWWLWGASLAAGLLGEVLYQTTRDDSWFWGWGGAWANRGYWPWPAWLAAGIVTVQVLHAFRLISSGWRDLRPGMRSRLSAVLIGGWMVALYLLLFDRFVHLRFHLQFVSDELHFLYRWLQR